jgi:hypothetical protein
MTKEIVAGILGLASVAGGGFGAHKYLDSTYAEIEPVMVAGAQVNFILERQEEGLVREIAALEREQARVGRLTPTQRDHLEGLRKRLDELRQVRKGKK